MLEGRGLQTNPLTGSYGAGMNKKKKPLIARGERLVGFVLPRLGEWIGLDKLVGTLLSRFLEDSLYIFRLHPS